MPKHKESDLKRNKEYLKNRDSLQSDRIIDTYRMFDEQKKWLQEKIKSKEYLARLTKEFGGDETKARAEQKSRLDELDKDYVLESSEKIEDDVPGAAAYYDYDKTHLPHNGYDLENTAVHEYQHQSTRGNMSMSDYAKDLYKKGFDPTKTTKEIVVNGRTGEEYFGTPTEMDARKKELELDMERFNIKKYGEKFTPKHLESLLKLQKKGIISNEFLEMTKPEYLLKIMNTIAGTETKDKNQENLS
jgi:hypothetical protein